MSSPLPVLILSNERDFAADSVVDDLTERLKVPVVRWNAENLGEQAAHWTVPERVDAPRFRSVWLRQYLPDPTPSASVPDIDEALVVAAQWRAWLPCLDDGHTSWINPLWASRRAESKIVQLREARAAGLSVPETVVTSSRAVAADFRLTHGEVVVKTLSAAYFAHSDQSFVFTEPLTDRLLQDSTAWRQQPIVVQARLRGRADVRVVVVDGQAFAAELPRDYDTTALTIDAADWRLSPDRDWSPARLSTTMPSAACAWSPNSACDTALST